MKKKKRKENETQNETICKPNLINQEQTKFLGHFMMINDIILMMESKLQHIELIRNIYLAPAGKSFSDINCAEFGLSFCWRCLFGLIFQEIYFISQYNLANGTLLTFSTCTSLKSNVKRYQRSTLCSFQYMVHGIHFFGMKKRTWFNYITQYFFTKTTLTVFVTPGLFTTTQ